MFRKHLAFIDSDQYADILRWEYGLAVGLASSYEEANLNLVNGVWSGFDSVVQGKSVEEPSLSIKPLKPA